MEVANYKYGDHMSQINRRDYHSFLISITDYVRRRRYKKKKKSFFLINDTQISLSYFWDINGAAVQKLKYICHSSETLNI